MSSQNSMTRFPLVRTVAMVFVAASLLGAIAGTAYLAFAQGEARLRDTAPYFLARHAADFAGIDLGAVSPMVVNRVFDLHGWAEAARFTLGGAMVAMAFGFPFAFLLALVLGAARPVSPRFDSEWLPGWLTQSLVVLLLSPQLLVVADELVLTFGPQMKVRTERELAVAITFIVCVVAAVSLRMIARDGWRLARRLGQVSMGALVLLVVGLAWPTPDPVSVTRVAAPRGAPNVLLISIDTLRADHVHCYGYERKTTPNLDRLADEGAHFTEAIAPTSWTLPSHLTMLTALPPEIHGVVRDGQKLGQGVPTLTEILADHGYATAGFVSGAYLDGRFGFSRGFDHYDDYSAVRLSGEAASNNVSSARIASLSREWLETWSGKGRKRPFFLFLHFFDVHAKYVPPAPWNRMFDPDYNGPADDDPTSITLHPGWTTRDYEHLAALYDGEIAWTDHNVGAVIEDLRRLGILDRTVVIVTSDHGEEFLEHGGIGHRHTLYDESIRVPLIVRYPKVVPKGVRVEKQVRTMDLPPTILSLAGIGRPDSHDGSGWGPHDLSALFDSTSARSFPDLPAFGDLEVSAGHIRSVRTRDWKYIELADGTRELYALGPDPGERRNVIRTSGQGEILQAQLRSWLERCAEAAKKAGDVELTDEQKETLRSLGYLQ